jgi:hypothetical protein
MLVDSPDIPLGEKLSGWVAAHRTAIWNSDATLDLPVAVARKADVTLGSSVPLIENELLIGTLTLYSPSGSEIALEQRVLIQAIAPMLASVLSSALAHDEVVAVDGTDPHDRETLYSVMDTLLSSGARSPDRNDADRLIIVRVKWHVDPSVREHYDSMHETLERAIGAATNSAGHVIRLAVSEVLIVAPQKHLAAAGLAPRSATRAPRPTAIEVTEIANSLQLREVLGLTSVNEQQTPVGKPLIH